MIKGRKKGILLIILSCIISLLVGFAGGAYYGWIHPERFSRSVQTVFCVAGYYVAPWVTIVGVIAGVIGMYIALQTYLNNNSIQKWKLIEKIYSGFLENDCYELYQIIQKNGEIDLTDKEKGKTLNKMLSLFDEISYLQSQNLLDEKAWEYIACEVHHFNRSKSVREFINKTEEEYKDEGFPEEIIPFSGLSELLGKIPEKFKIKNS